LVCHLLCVVLLVVLFFSYCGHRRDLHSFPTRRSSDLGAAGLTASAGIAGWVEMLMLRAKLNARIGRTGLASGYVATLWFSAQCRSEEHTSELQSLAYLVCRLLLEKKKKHNTTPHEASS